MYLKVGLYIAVLFSCETEGHPPICGIINGPWAHYAKWVSQTEKDKYCMAKLGESKMVVTGGWGDKIDVV